MAPRITLGSLLVVTVSFGGCATLLGLDEDRELRVEAGGGGIGGAGGAEARYVAAVLADSPAAYFRFEEPSGPFFDTVVPTRKLTVIGTVEYAAPGAVGVGVGFTGGTGRLQLGVEDFGFVGTVPMTIEAWARTTNRDTFQDVVGKLELVGADQVGWSLRYRPEGHGWFFTRGNTTGSRNLDEDVVDPSVYAHIVMTFDGTTARLYVNGGEPKETVGTSSEIALPETPVPFRIGGLETGNAFIGSVDEIAVYTDALSAERVQAHYEAGISP